MNITGEPQPNEPATDNELAVDATETMPSSEARDETPHERGYPGQIHYVPDSMAETTRKSGMAWSAGIVFFSSIAFMLVLGWFADLLLGSSPWGIVGGIVLGSVIGFLQFFRITSKIFGQQNSETPPRTLISDDRDE